MKHYSVYEIRGPLAHGAGTVLGASGRRGWLPDCCPETRPAHLNPFSQKEETPGPPHKL